MALTPEEKEKRKRATAEARRLQEQKFPSTRYAPQDVQIIFDAGWNYSFTIRAKNISLFKPDEIDGTDGWVRAYIPLRGIEEVASLAAAIVCRLNAMVERANADLAKTKTAKLVLPDTEKAVN